MVAEVCIVSVNLSTYAACAMANEKALELVTIDLKLKRKTHLEDLTRTRSPPVPDSELPNAVAPGCSLREATDRGTQKTSSSSSEDT
jgi:hypothetical protein